MSTAARNWAEISLPALRHNFRYIRGLVPPATAICAIVKADAYGHGAVACARVFRDEGAEWLAVTSAEEGLRLRRAGIAGRILVLAGFAAPEAAALIEHDLTPAIWDVAQIGWLCSALPRRRRRPFAVHVKFESGMGRLGLTREQEPALLAALKLEPRLQLEAAFSHLASSEAADAALSRNQYLRFQQTRRRLRAGTGRAPSWHLLNSEGTLRFARWRGDMVRVGLALYGYSVQPRHAARLVPALTWKARLVGVKELSTGHGVGYGARFRTRRRTRIGVLAVGYADGYRRDLYPGARVGLGGQAVPVIGNISMDLTTVDLTGAPPLRLGEEATLLGPGISAMELAAVAKTIPYEILCGLSARVERRYH